MNKPDRTFGGRIRPKEDNDSKWEDLLELPNQGKAFVYQRLSTHEQVKEHVYSVQAQDDLVDLAKKDGYVDKQIYVEDRDLGISGTEGKEEREGLAHLISEIAAGVVEAVYVVDISRLFRDQTLINALTFGELCKEHDVLIVTPHMRLNLMDRMHMRIYRMEAERAAEELEIMRSRLHGGRRIKAQQGCYVGSSLPVGYILDDRKQVERNGQMVDNPNHHKYRIYEPHAEIVRKLFDLARFPGMTVVQMIKKLNAEGIAFPPLPSEITRVKANRKSFARSKRNADGSWPLTVARVRSILQNPAYISWWIYEGQLLKKDNHPSIVDEEAFWAAQKIFGTEHRPKKTHPPLPLSGLVYCGDHQNPRRLIYANTSNEDRYPIYQCTDKLSTHFTVRAIYLDGPIAEAVISQCAYPELADQVLERVLDEYEQTKAHLATLEAEERRLEKQIENLEHNFANAMLTQDRIHYIEAEIAKRRARLTELSKLKQAQISDPDKRTVSEQDVQLVRQFLADLEQGWDNQPNELKNVFFRLVLKKVIIRHEPAKIEAKIVWQTGLEQCIIIYRPYFKPCQHWTEEERAIVKEYYATTSRERLLELLPDRHWRQIRKEGRRLGIKRQIKTKAKRMGPYAPWEDDLLRDYVRGKFTMREMQDKLHGRSADSIRDRVTRLGLLRDYETQPDWEWASNTNLFTIEDRSGPAAQADC